MNAPRTVRVDELVRTLRPSRRPDVAAGVLVAVLQLAELPDIDADHRRVISLALRDLAHAFHPEADTVFAELVHAPDGVWVDEDELACPTCDGQPNDQITALTDQLDAAVGRNSGLVIEVARLNRLVNTLARALAKRVPANDEPAAGTLPEEDTP
ncbi:hypothetical protein ACWEVP_31875 [Amycolatopsis sp. NPDC003865]